MTKALLNLVRNDAKRVEMVISQSCKISCVIPHWIPCKSKSDKNRLYLDHLEQQQNLELFKASKNHVC